MGLPIISTANASCSFDRQPTGQLKGCTQQATAKYKTAADWGCQPATEALLLAGYSEKKALQKIHKIICFYKIALVPAETLQPGPDRNGQSQKEGRHRGRLLESGTRPTTVASRPATTPCCDSEKSHQKAKGTLRPMKHDDKPTEK